MYSISFGLVFLYTLSPIPLTNEALEPPPEGKAVVYLGRMAGFVGRYRPFHFFHEEQYLARVKGKNYLRYVCEPGKTFFWVAAETRTFVKADLEAGRSYALFAKIQAGTWSARAELRPITKESEAWKEFSGMIRGSKPDKINEKYLAKWKRKHPEYIKKALAEWRVAGEPSVSLRKDEYLE